jgi:hypothetical protein
MLQEVRDYWESMYKHTSKHVMDYKGSAELDKLKEWVSSMEDKSIETLRLTIQRLLNDFENEGKHNIVKDFEARKGETKH